MTEYAHDDKETTLESKANSSETKGAVSMQCRSFRKRITNNSPVLNRASFN